MIKLIASDLDGTLLQNGAQRPSPKIFDLTLRLKEKGIHFAAASGRQLYSQHQLFAPVKNDISYIAENGSLCVCRGQVIAKGIIERDLGLRIIQASGEFEGSHTLLSCESHCYTDSTSETFIRHLRDELLNDIVYCPDLSSIQEPFLKLAACDFHGTDNLLPYFKKRFGNQIEVVTSGNLWVDFIAPGANKGTALKALAEHLGIAPEECIAFGDQYNDIEMLEYAGIGYAMKNAAPGVEKHADAVTDSVEKVLTALLQNAN